MRIGCSADGYKPVFGYVVPVCHVPGSLTPEIAELTGKQHKNLLKAIRNMEPAWEKVQGLKFQLLQKTYQLPNGGTA